MITYLFKNKKLILIVTSITYLIGFTIINTNDQILAHFFMEKVWIHRVNSIEKLKEVAKKYDRVEIDVVFQEGSNSFDVNHPPEKSINLSLQNYLSSIEISTKKRFWIDYKNLSNINMKNSCDKLDSICKTLNIKRNQIIVESTNPKYLKPFSHRGFNTSYYLPATLNKVPKELLNEKMKSIKITANLNKTNFISANMSDYEIIIEHFPDNRILTWGCALSKPLIINPIKLLREAKLLVYKYKVLSDKNVSVVLFRYQAKKGNR